MINSFKHILLISIFVFNLITSISCIRLTQGTSASATWHAEYAGTVSVTREQCLKNTYCIDYFAGYGLPGIEAQNKAYPMLDAMGTHISATMLMGNFPCGSCVQVTSTASGKTDYVTIIDQGGAGGFDLHPEIYLNLFGRDTTVANGYSFFAGELYERYKGLGGGQAVTATKVDNSKCQGNTGTSGGAPAATNTATTQKATPAPTSTQTPAPVSAPATSTLNPAPIAQATPTAPTPSVSAPTASIPSTSVSSTPVISAPVAPTASSPNSSLPTSQTPSVPNLNQGTQSAVPPQQQKETPQNTQPAINMPTYNVPNFSSFQTGQQNIQTQKNTPVSENTTQTSQSSNDQSKFYNKNNIKGLKNAISSLPSSVLKYLPFSNSIPNSNRYQSFITLRQNNNTVFRGYNNTVFRGYNYTVFRGNNQTKIR